MTGRDASRFLRPCETSMIASSRYIPDWRSAQILSIPFWICFGSLEYSDRIVGRSPMPMTATSFLRPAAFGFVISTANGTSAVRMCEMCSVAAWLVSTSSAICIGSSAGVTRSTSRVRLSSFTTKSDGPRSGTGVPSRSTTLT